MKPYKIEFKKLIFYTGMLMLIIFSAVLLIFHMVEWEKLGELLLHNGYLIAPITLLWVSMENYFWHTRPFQSMRKWLHLPPDIRGRWEGQLQSSIQTEPQKFVLDIKQSLTTLKVLSETSRGKSQGVLVDLAFDEARDQFVLCFLWAGEIPVESEGRHLIQRFHGYTMLWLTKEGDERILDGSYFTDHRPVQSSGSSRLVWKGHSHKGKH